MAGEIELSKLLKGMKPRLNAGEYVFVSMHDSASIDRNLTLCEFKEIEGTTVVVERSIADNLGLRYDFIASWITLEIHSSLHAVGLTAAVATELTKNNISCNVIAAYYHDHLFVDKEDSKNALEILKNLSERNS